MEIGDLPPELIMEILRRLNFKDMMKSKCICKRWEALISDPTFLQYRRRLLCQSSTNKQPSNPIRLLVCRSDFITDRNGININGKKQLHLSTSNNINEYSSGTFKLALDKAQKQRENPDWDKYYCSLGSMGLGRVDSTKEYKVVRVFETFSEWKCEVFTLGSDDHWRTAAAPPFAICDDPGAFVAGGFYMLLEWVEREKGIARFDIEREEWTVIPLPKCFFLFGGGCRTNLSIREVGGLFCLTDNSSGWSADMWVLKDYKQGIWALKSRIEFSYLFDEEEYPHLYPLFLDYGDGKVLLVSVDDYFAATKLISYDPKIQNVEELPIPHPNGNFTVTFFTESFEPLF